MHFENRLFWMSCAREYPHYFKDPSRVIEFGSLNINGSVRNVFKCSDYTGVDWMDGADVDLVSLAHEVSFESMSFDTVVSASMLEHDPYWKKSLIKMIELLKKDGLLAISWGTALNAPHHFKTAPDGEFHALKAGSVLQLLESYGLYIHLFKYERTLCIESGDKEFIELRIKDKLYGMGCAVLIAFKDRNQAKGNQIIKSLIDEDKI